MYALHNLLKLNDLKEKHPSYDTLNLEQLQAYSEKYKKLTSDQKLVNSLPDKGEKLKNQLKHIEELIEIKSGKKDENLNDIAATATSSKQTLQSNEKQIEVDCLADKIENLKVEKVEQKVSSVGSTEKPQKQPKEKQGNYFANVASKEKKSQELKIDEAKLKEVKQKVLKSMETRYKYSSTKELSVDESCKLLQEHEARVKEIQMKQAAERLLQGRSINYEFNFVGRRDDESSRYREPKPDRINDDETLYGEDDEDEENAAFDYAALGEDEANVNSKIDQVYKSSVEKNKYKLGDDLDNIDLF